MSTSLNPDRGRQPLDPQALHPVEAPTLQVEVKPDRILVRPAGELDLATADSLERRIVELLRNGSARVVVDLRAVTFIDSSGIRALLNAQRQAGESGRSMSIILGGPAIRRTLEIAGVTDHLELEPDCRDGTP